MRMEQGVRTGLGHGGITCVLQTQFSSSSYISMKKYVVSPHQNCLTKTVLMWGHNICFLRKN